MEEAGGERGTGEGEAASGVEEQEQHTEAVHNESAQTRQDDLRCKVGEKTSFFVCFHLLKFLGLFFI